MVNSTIELWELCYMGRKVLIGICGGIAAYKVCEVVSTLVKSGVEVRAILTDAAQQFITPLSLSTLCRYPAYTDQDFWQPSHGRPLHIQLGEWAELIVIAPLTANTLAKLVYGFADNLLTNTILASTCPILLAPAMNTDMWEQPTVRGNWQQVLTEKRFHVIAPSAGMLACDRVGQGRMGEPKEIITNIKSLLYTAGKRDLAGRKMLISAGGTREHLDPVRFIGNPSTGKMGTALAQAALHRGANVTLVHSIVGELLLSGVKVIEVVSAAQMQQAMLTHFAEADIVVMTAAVADIKPTEYYGKKLPKRSLPSSLPLTPVPDIVAELGKLKQSHQYLIGFAAQTGDIVAPALEKLRVKNLDTIVANPIDREGAGIGSNTNQGVFLDVEGRRLDIPSCSKLEMAHRLWDFVLESSGLLLRPQSGKNPGDAQE